MNLLLDTNVLIWFLSGSTRISSKDRALIETEALGVSVSAVSLFEIATKAAISKLHAPRDLAVRVAAARFRALPLAMHHAEAVRDLPLHHRDPFDRLLVAQARIENLTLATADRQLAAYDVRTVEVGTERGSLDGSVLPLVADDRLAAPVDTAWDAER
ncbi:MAG: type II toxin-antitoxin system VapC family toxin [Patulibacter sp.]